MKRINSLLAVLLAVFMLAGILPSAFADDPVYCTVSSYEELVNAIRSNAELPQIPAVEEQPYEEQPYEEQEEYGGEEYDEPEIYQGENGEIYAEPAAWTETGEYIPPELIITLVPAPDKDKVEIRFGKEGITIAKHQKVTIKSEDEVVFRPGDCDDPLFTVEGGAALNIEYAGTDSFTFSAERDDEWKEPYDEAFIRSAGSLKLDGIGFEDYRAVPLSVGGDYEHSSEAEIKYCFFYPQEADELPAALEIGDYATCTLENCEFNGYRDIESAVKGDTLSYQDSNSTGFKEEEPAVEEEPVEEPADEEPAEEYYYEEPYVEEVEEPVIEEPVVEQQPIYEQPVEPVEEPQPAIEQYVEQQPVIEQQFVEQPVQQQYVEQPVQQPQQVVEEPQQQFVEQPVQQPQQIVEEPQQQFVEQPVQQPVEQQPVVEPQPAQQPVEQQPVEQQPVEQQPVEKEKNTIQDLLMELFPKLKEEVKQEVLQEVKEEQQNTAETENTEQPAAEPASEQPVEQQTAPPVGQNIKVVSLWTDNQNYAGKRPESTLVYLYKDGNVVSTARLSAAEGWTYTFRDLQPGEYNIAEQVIDSYTSSYSTPENDRDNSILIMHYYSPATSTTTYATSGASGTTGYNYNYNQNSYTPAPSYTAPANNAPTYNYAGTSGTAAVTVTPAPRVTPAPTIAPAITPIPTVTPAPVSTDNEIITQASSRNNSHVGLWIALLGVSAVGCAAAIIYYLKLQKKSRRRSRY